MIASARDASELHASLPHLFWVRSKALGSLVLPEQVNPYDGSPLSVAPLSWSHAQLVSVVRAYLAALEKYRHAIKEIEVSNEFEIDRADPVDNP